MSSYKIYNCGVYRDATPEEIAEWENDIANQPDPTPTPEERIAALEQTKAEQTDVDELHEALNMILTGVTE